MLCSKKAVLWEIWTIVSCSWLYIYKYIVFTLKHRTLRGCEVECYLLIMGEERKCTSRVRKCTVNNPLITHLARFLGRQRWDGDTVFSPSPLRGSIHYKKNGLFISALDILKCFLGVASTFLIVTINEIGCCMMFDWRLRVCLHRRPLKKGMLEYWVDESWITSYTLGKQSWEITIEVLSKRFSQSKYTFRYKNML